MHTSYYKEYTPDLKREMEFKVYGHAGQPCLALPCEGGRFYDWEDRGLAASLAPFIEGGQLRLFCADGVDGESWLSGGEGRPRAEMQERWFNYLCGELVPRALGLAGEAGRGDCRLLAMGAGLGALHAVSLYLRRPALFCGAVGLSGSYKAGGWFGGYSDDLTLRSSPVDLLRLLPREKLPTGGPLLLCCGQGPYEERFLAETRELAAALAARQVPHTLELWGADSAHDWPWWQKQLPIFVGRALAALGA